MATGIRCVPPTPDVGWRSTLHLAIRGRVSSWERRDEDRPAHMTHAAPTESLT